MILFFFPARLRCLFGNLASTRRLVRMAVIALMALGASVCAHARRARPGGIATLVEAADYMPCGNACTTFASPVTAVCVAVDGQVLVAEAENYLHDRRTAWIGDLVGKPVRVRFTRRSLWLLPADQAAAKLHRGSEFEGFKDPGCIREVHKPIQAVAYAHKRPASVPADAFALAGSGRGEYPALYLWFECNLQADGRTIACKRWYRDGVVDSTDWFCAATADGAQVGKKFAIDPELSQASRLVSVSGAVLQHDDRSRTNGKLDFPNEACR